MKSRLLSPDPEDTTATRAMGWRGCGFRWRLCARATVAVLAVWALVAVMALYGVASLQALGSPRSLSPPAVDRQRQLQGGGTTAASPWDDSTRPSPTEEDDVMVEPWLDAEPLVDHSVPSQDDLFSALQDHVPNFPIAYWNSYDKLFRKRRPGKCSKLSQLSELEFSNDYWQLLRSSNGTFAWFGAYLDVRRKETPVVRVLGMVDRMQPSKPFCQLWFQDNINPVVTRVNESRYIWVKNWGNNDDRFYQPFLFTCPFPKEKLASPPVAVSAVEKQCDKATNILRVIYNKPNKKQNFAVCVKGLDYLHVDLSVRLVEWIELLSILGVDKIIFYKLHIHPNITKVLDFYEKTGKVQVVPVTLPVQEPNLPILQHYFLQKKFIHKRQNEVIPYNDCLYKNLYSYRYISLLDIDEVIMPVNVSSWVELVEEQEKTALAARKRLPSFFVVRNVYFLDDARHEHSFFKDVPKYMHMMQHVYRSKNFTKPGAYIKGLHNTDSVVTVHNHFPRSCLGACDFFPVDTRDAQLQHYRSDCVRELNKACADYRKNSVIDSNIWRFKEPVVKRVVNVLKTLGFLSSKDQMS